MSERGAFQPKPSWSSPEYFSWSQWWGEELEASCWTFAVPGSLMEKYFPTLLPISVCSQDEEVLTFDAGALAVLSSLLFSSDVVCCIDRFTWERPSSWFKEKCFLTKVILCTCVFAAADAKPTLLSGFRFVSLWVSQCLWASRVEEWGLMDRDGFFTPGSESPG